MNIYVKYVLCPALLIFLISFFNQFLSVIRNTEIILVKVRQQELLTENTNTVIPEGWIGCRQGVPQAVSRCMTDDGGMCLFATLEQPNPLHAVSPFYSYAISKLAVGNLIIPNALNKIPLIGGNSTANSLVKEKQTPDIMIISVIYLFLTKTVLHEKKECSS